MNFQDKERKKLERRLAEVMPPQQDKRPICLFCQNPFERTDSEVLCPACEGS
jgi:hypothetical protein